MILIPDTTTLPERPGRSRKKAVIQQLLEKSRAPLAGLGRWRPARGAGGMKPPFRNYRFLTRCHRWLPNAPAEGRIGWAVQEVRPSLNNKP
jgi:hypothetical protein